MKQYIECIYYDGVKEGMFSAYKTYEVLPKGNPLSQLYTIKDNFGKIRHISLTSCFPCGGSDANPSCARFKLVKKINS